MIISLRWPVDTYENHQQHSPPCSSLWIVIVDTLRDARGVFTFAATLEPFVAVTVVMSGPVPIAGKENNRDVSLAINKVFLLKPGNSRRIKVVVVLALMTALVVRNAKSLDTIAAILCSYIFGSATNVPSGRRTIWRTIDCVECTHETAETGFRKLFLD